MAIDGITDVYTDAGVCTAGKSWAGSWAYVLLDGAGAVVREDSGPATAAAYGQPTVENNFLETLAAVIALEHMPDGWAGTLHCDNQNAIRRVFDPAATKFGGVPPAVVERVRVLRRRLGRFKTRLLAGHPSKKQLAGGFKKGRPVSVHNKRCDTLATAVRRELQRGRQGS